MNKLLQLARLNARVAGLALRGRWLSVNEVAAGYNCVAPTYNTAWQHHLCRATDDFLQRVPSGLSGTVLDLGCGTGYATRWLARANLAASVVGVDISGAMLDWARADAPPNLKCVQADMLAYVCGQRAGGAALIVSTWALGYSHPARVIRECGRVLSVGSTLAFIVNYADTLAPVFRAFRRCLFEFPDCVRLAAWPRFPKNRAFLETSLRRAGFEPTYLEDGQQHIVPPDGELLPWLKQTGILAGFDSMLELSGPVAACFEAELGPHRANLYHHYAVAVARRK
jgi:trans-aconitate methyltransferase